MNKVKRPPIARSVGIPKTVHAKVRAIRLLTEEINEIVVHLGTRASHSRDTYTRIALEHKVNQRGRLLNSLLEQDLAKHRALVREIKGENGGNTH